MGNIVLLDDLTINKIAAGEVVERPASVVKELVENSIDAGATNISVEIKNGGISYIRITDNGKGIASDDMEIAFERHATSKIRQAEDLDTVKSMGFRGEALASVAAISNVEMISKQADSDIGNRIVVEAGNVLEKHETGCPTGTTITVKNLFFNTPVRYKFLKKDYTEAGYIEDAITRLALINPGIAFKLVSNGKVIVKTYGDNNLNNVIYSIFGKDISAATVNVDYEYEGIHVSGVVGKPEIARSNRTNQIFFVNKRYVKDKTLSGATEQAFKGMLPIGKYGFLVLNIEVNPAKVDVNVHPAKLEVRFEEENNVFKAVYHAIKDTLLKTELIEDTTNEPDDTTKEMGLSVIEEKEKGMFGKFFKNKKKKEEWEIPEEGDKNNLIANIYNAKNGIETEKLEDKKVGETSEQYNPAKAQLNSMNLDINANVFEKIAMLQKQVAEDLEKNPNIVFDRSKLEEEKRKLEELRKMEQPTTVENVTVPVIQEQEESEQDSINNQETIEQSNETRETQEVQEDENQAESIENKEEQQLVAETIMQEISQEVQIEENIESNLEETKIEEQSEEKTEQIEQPEVFISNNQILQESEEPKELDNIDRILKEAIARKFNTENPEQSNYIEQIYNQKENDGETAEVNGTTEEKGDFNEMYAKIFGTNPNEARERKIQEANNANDIAVLEGDRRAQFNAYKPMGDNNFSVFDDRKVYGRPNYKFIGIAFSTYIILEIKKELYILDQHAAHERIMYEKVKKNFYNNEEKDSQMLLLPDIINLTHKELDIVKDNWDVFEKAGFQLEYFGENTIKLTGVPDICFDLDTKELFLETLDEINTVARTAKQEIEERFIATIACKAAVKANMALNDAEVHALLEELLRLPNPFTCPHGRPTAIKMNKFDIEKKFSRRK